jgi:hypothetical protein
VVEHVWAKPFVDAVADSGGQWLGSGRVPTVLGPTSPKPARPDRPSRAPDHTAPRAGPTGSAGGSGSAFGPVARRRRAASTEERPGITKDGTRHARSHRLFPESHPMRRDTKSLLDRGAAAGADCNCGPPQKVPPRRCRHRARRSD